MHIYRGRQAGWIWDCSDGNMGTAAKEIHVMGLGDLLLCLDDLGLETLQRKSVSGSGQEEDLDVRNFCNQTGFL